jgi:basic membrane lipoprotein Med (substrate-binding protein (PBP1-ABC) superfamily)
MSTAPRLAPAVLLLAASSLQCSLLVSSDLKAGLGRPCSLDGDCQASECIDGICAVRCFTNDVCPASSACLGGRCRAGCRDDSGCPASQVCASAVCQPQYRVAAILPGPTDGQDGWSTSHKLGLTEAISNPMFAAVRFGSDPFALKDSVTKAADYDAAIDSYVAQGAKIIFTASSLGGARSLTAAQKYPNVSFILAGQTDNGSFPNVGAYYAKGEQPWYATGQLAARLARAGSKCVGIVLPQPSHLIVRETNAFVLGVRAQDATVKIVVRWVGATSDPNSAPTFPYKATHYAYDSGGTDSRLFREELLAAQIADLGCSVVVHRTDTQRVVSAVETKLKVPVAAGTYQQKLFSMGIALKDACRSNLASDGTWLDSCLGSLYWNWGGLYGNILGQIMSGTWMGQVDAPPFGTDANALLKFELNPNPSSTGISSDEAGRDFMSAAGTPTIFKGPFSFNGQRDNNRDGIPDMPPTGSQDVATGQVLSDDELGRICWFIQGIYELPDYTVPDPATLIPAMVPYGPPVAGQTTTLVDGQAPDLQKYGDVIRFLTALGRDPTSEMNCGTLE